MNKEEINDPFKSLVLFGLKEKLNFLIDLYSLKKFPKVLMLSGKKGSGKFTLINHFLNYIYDGDNYDLDNFSINDLTNFYKQYSNGTFPNILYLSGNNFKNIRIDDVRNLKSTLLKSTILDKERFIILDDVELFNTNSLNALLKLIEEPNSKNYFVLINNQTKPLIETIQSRCLIIRILLNNETRLKIINSLIKKNQLEVFIDFKITNLTPGSFLLFNNICFENNISIDGDFLENLKILLNVYKKSKDSTLINMILFFTDYYFYNLNKKKGITIKNSIENKNFIIDNINKFITYNLNQNSLINAIDNKISNG